MENYKPRIRISQMSTKYFANLLSATQFTSLKSYVMILIDLEFLSKPTPIKSFIKNENMLQISI